MIKTRNKYKFYCKKIKYYIDINKNIIKEVEYILKRKIKKYMN